MCSEIWSSLAICDHFQPRNLSSRIRCNCSSVKLRENWGSGRPRASRSAFALLPHPVTHIFVHRLSIGSLTDCLPIDFDCRRHASSLWSYFSGLRFKSFVSTFPTSNVVAQPKSHWCWVLQCCLTVNESFLSQLLAAAYPAVDHLLATLGGQI